MLLTKEQFVVLMFVFHLIKKWSPDLGKLLLKLFTSMLVSVWIVTHGNVMLPVQLANIGLSSIGQIWWLWRLLEYTELISMFREPVWDYLIFVICSMILLGVAIRGWVHCSHERIGQRQQQYSCLLVRSPKLCQENIPQTITTSSAWTVYATQCRSILSFCLHQILTLPSEWYSRLSNLAFSQWSVVLFC